MYSMLEKISAKIYYTELKWQKFLWGISHSFRQFLWRLPSWEHSLHCFVLRAATTANPHNNASQLLPSLSFSLSPLSLSTLCLNYFSQRAWQESRVKCRAKGGRQPGKQAKPFRERGVGQLTPLIDTEYIIKPATYVSNNNLTAYLPQ